MKIQKFMLDQFAPIAVYEKLKKRFKDEVSFLFESAGNSEGNYSIIIIGARERIKYQDGVTTYQDQAGCLEVINDSPFDFLKSYYAKIDQAKYKAYTKELGLGYVDGFIG